MYDVITLSGMLSMIHGIRNAFHDFVYNALLCFTFTFIISAPRGKMLILSVKLSYVTDQEKPNRIL